MIVMKFGGTSVRDSRRIRSVVDIVRSSLSRNPIVVVSAMGGMTDSLLRITGAASQAKCSQLLEDILDRHYEAIGQLGLDRSIILREVEDLRRVSTSLCGKKHPKAQELDELMSFGERMAARIVSACISSTGIASSPCDAYDIGMVTDSCFGNADIIPGTLDGIREALAARDGVPVITGFIGKDRDGNITTFGRGGSDYTASIVGAAVGAQEIQIWTDVDGIMTADPRIVSTAINVKALSYEEEAELETLGAANLNPKGIYPAMEKGIPVRVLNTLNPEHTGTTISKDCAAKNRVASITYRKDIRVIRVEAPRTRPRELGRLVVETFGRHSVPIKSISVDGGAALVAVDQKHDTSAVVEELGRAWRISIASDMAQISLVGNGIDHVPDIAETLSSSLKGVEVALMAAGPSGINRSVVVKKRHMVRAVRLLHTTFFGR